MKKNSIVIREAKDVLRRDGWTQGVMGGPGQPHCVLGAFRAAAFPAVEDWPESEGAVIREVPAAKAFELCVINEDDEDEPIYDVVDWNDSDYRTLEDVLATMEKCAQKEEQAGR